MEKNRIENWNNLGFYKEYGKKIELKIEMISAFSGSWKVALVRIVGVKLHCRMYGM